MATRTALGPPAAGPSSRSRTTAAPARWWRRPRERTGGVHARPQTKKERAVTLDHTQTAGRPAPSLGLPVRRDPPVAARAPGTPPPPSGRRSTHVRRHGGAQTADVRRRLSSVGTPPGGGRVAEMGLRNAAVAPGSHLGRGARVGPAARRQTAGGGGGTATEDEVVAQTSRRPPARRAGGRQPSGCAGRNGRAGSQAGGCGGRAAKRPPRPRSGRGAAAAVGL